MYLLLKWSPWNPILPVSHSKGRCSTLRTLKQHLRKSVSMNFYHSHCSLGLSLAGNITLRGA